jgi:hypothetical protein
MDAYIPADFAAGILGGKGGDDELDGIQAFKKDMKAKEQKDTPPSPQESREVDADRPRKDGVASSGALSSDKPLDEIQLFRLMMKKEQDQKVPEVPHAPASEPIPTGPTVHEVENGAPGRAGIRDQRKILTLSNGIFCLLHLCSVTDRIQTCR